MLISPNALEAYRRLEGEGKLRMRIDGAVVLNDFHTVATTEEESATLLARRSEFDSQLIDIGIKYFTDGTPLSKTALLVEPYADIRAPAVR